MGWIREVAAPHKCRQPDKVNKATHFEGSVWQCDVCLDAWEITGFTFGGAPLYVKLERKS